MAQTDRQTDKATAWIATAYNDEIELLEDASRYPSFVKEVHGGREVCSQTGKLHFQGAIILHAQQRLSALKRWLPTTHLEPARSKEAIKRYCMKQETAAGDKIVRENAHPYFRMDELLTLLGNVIRDFRKHCMEDYIDLITEDDDRNKEYWFAVNEVIRRYPRTISSFAQSAVKTAWRYTSENWISQPTLSITESADKSDSNLPACQEEDDLISPARI